MNLEWFILRNRLIVYDIKHGCLIRLINVSLKKKITTKYIISLTKVGKKIGKRR